MNSKLTVAFITPPHSSDPSGPAATCACETTQLWTPIMTHHDPSFIPLWCSWPSVTPHDLHNPALAPHDLIVTSPSASRQGWLLQRPWDIRGRHQQVLQRLFGEHWGPVVVRTQERNSVSTIIINLCCINKRRIIRPDFKHYVYENAWQEIDDFDVWYTVPKTRASAASVSE